MAAFQCQDFPAVVRNTSLPEMSFLSTTRSFELSAAVYIPPERNTCWKRQHFMTASVSLRHVENHFCKCLPEIVDGEGNYGKAWWI